ncbi:MAG: UxaA family hydrolase [Chromatiales bacterium]|nr:UxaA family hydrolase [Chromatiales bacterium]
MQKIVVLNDRDNVATSLGELEKGQTVTPHAGDEAAVVIIREPIEFGHKFAITDITAGGDIVKYGEVIGVAAGDIVTGDWVHTHNVDAVRGRGDK